MRANYGYADGSGEYYLTIDTERCDGCGDCVPVCPAAVFAVEPDDYDEPKAVVRTEVRRRLAEVCPGRSACERRNAVMCHSACPRQAIEHTW
ncbi:MAG: 4Fe-4S binding protein [Deltaproteobacteria bacterium]|nr:4Fe-4S binding protein [Deltaproteobacteria bacterium]